MWIRGAALALAMALAGCDDTLYPPQYIEYEPNWLGVQSFSVTFCRECHCEPGVSTCDSSFEDVPIWPEALAADRECWDDVCVTPPSSCAGLSCDDCRLRECGEYVVPANPEDSFFWQVISPEDRPGGTLEMPPAQPLSPEQVEFVREWILSGAPL